MRLIFSRRCGSLDFVVVPRASEAGRGSWSFEITSVWLRALRHQCNLFDYPLLVRPPSISATPAQPHRLHESRARLRLIHHQCGWRFFGFSLRHTALALRELGSEAVPAHKGAIHHPPLRPHQRRQGGLSVGPWRCCAGLSGWDQLDRIPACGVQVFRVLLSPSVMEAIGQFHDQRRRRNMMSNEEVLQAIDELTPAQKSRWRRGGTRRGAPQSPSPG